MPCRLASVFLWLAGVSQNPASPKKPKPEAGHCSGAPTQGEVFPFCRGAINRASTKWKNEPKGHALIINLAIGD
jgi:hypothetical protein